MGRTRKRAQENSGLVHPDVRVRLRAGEAFYGPGVQELLKRIDETGSLQEACIQMELSYSKGRKMIKRLEEKIGCPMTRRQSGGIGGGGSVLTEQGKRLVEQYEQMTADIQAFAEKAYKEYMGDDFWKREEKEA